MSDVSRSTIYRSEGVQFLKRTTTVHVEGRSQRLHMFMIWTSGMNYTQEQLDECNGAFNCYNCNRPIKKEIVFYPLYKTKTGVPVFHPTPHCTQGCAYRTVLNLPNNYDLLGVWTLIYGAEVKPVPDRLLLFLPGGMSMEQYHTVAEQGAMYGVERAHVRSFLAPVYVSAVLMDPNKHALYQEVAQEIESLHLESETPLQQPATNGTATAVQDQQHRTVVNLLVRKPGDSKLASVFSMDPASSRGLPVNAEYDGRSLSTSLSTPLSTSPFSS